MYGGKSSGREPTRMGEKKAASGQKTFFGFFIEKEETPKKITA